MKQEGKLDRANPYSETSKLNMPEDYEEALRICVKPSLRLIYDQLMENLSGMDNEDIDTVMVDDLLAAFRASLMMWEQIDKADRQSGA